MNDNKGGFRQSFMKNGLQILLVPVVHAKTITLLVLVPTGSRNETRDTNGLSHFIEHMLFKGTERRPEAALISCDLDALGADCNAFTSKEYTGYYVRAAADKLEIVADVLSDMLLNSRFDAAEIEKEKGAIIEEFNSYEDDPGDKIGDIFEECLYGDTPAGWDTLGTKNNVRGFKREDLIRYFRRQYDSRKAVICLAGNLNMTAAKELVAKYFGNWPQSSFEERFPIEENQSKPAAKIVFKKTDQINLSVGVRTFASGHRDELAVKLLAIVLGDSTSSRLYLELRERRGLAYDVSAYAENCVDAGYLSAQAGIPTDKLSEATEIILKEFQSLTTELVPENELRRVKDMLAGRLVLDLETSDDLAMWYGTQAIKGKIILTPEAWLEKINTVTAADLLRVAKIIFQDKNLNLAAIGPIKNKPGIIKKLHF
jgi:predicted Zn-dependent peptidase